MSLQLVVIDIKPAGIARVETASELEWVTPKGVTNEKKG